MSGVKFLLDTNIIIGFLKKKENVIERLKEKDINLSSCAYSAITRMELLGFPRITYDESNAIKNFLNDIYYFPIDRVLEDQTIKIRQLIKIKLPDAVIAATAIHHNIELITLDTELTDKVLHILNMNRD